jgi:putative transposase
LVRRDTPQTRYAFHGAIAIHRELENSGCEDKPNLSTINRVIKRNGLIEKERKARNSEGAKKYYPEIRAKYPGHVHQLDLVTPRYITGYGKVVSVNRVDVFTSDANLDQYPSKGADSIIFFLVDDWKTGGIPNFLQLDNECSFRGSLYHPRTFGKLTRFCLNFGVEIVFIPFNEPWRNAFIESFNDRFNTQLWLFQRFKDLEHLRSESRQFRVQHGAYQAYKKEHFSERNCTGYTRRSLPKNFSFDPATELPITKGLVHFVRWVNEQGYVNILNEQFFVHKDLCCEYIWATLNTRQQALNMYYQAEKESPRELVKTIDYKFREPVKDRIPVKEFCKVSAIS